MLNTIKEQLERELAAKLAAREAKPKPKPRAVVNRQAEAKAQALEKKAIKVTGSDLCYAPPSHGIFLLPMNG